MNPATALRTAIPATALVAALLPAHTTPSHPSASRSPGWTDAAAWAVPGTAGDDDRPYLKLGSPSDDDRPYLGAGGATVREGDSGTTTLTFTARLTDANGRTQASKAKITAEYKVSSEEGNTATAGKDYKATSGSITFAPGETSKTIHVTVYGDTEDEGDETLTLRWTTWDGKNVLLASYTATGTIEDDDDPATAPALAIADATADEGDDITFRVTLDKAVSGGLTLTPSFTNGTATAGDDYTANTTAIDFAGTAGETKTFSVATTDDSDREEDETFTVGLTVSGASIAVAATATATGTIRDNDSNPYLSLSSPSVTEGDAGNTTLTFTARLSDENGRTKSSSQTITAAYRVSSEEGNTATAGTDYTETSGTVTFAPGETSKTIDVTVHGDTEEEDDETLTLRWVNPWTNVLLASYTATGTIEDDDDPPPAAAALAIADATADEGDDITFTVTLDKAVSGGLTVTPSLTDGTATAGTDYDASTNGLDFVGIEGEQLTFSVATTEDPDWEEDEDFTVELDVSGTSQEVTATSVATGIIRNDDPNPYLSLTSPTVTEGDDGTTTLTFTASLSDANGGPQISSRAITATYRVSTEEGNTATAGKDYTETTGRLTFKPGETVKTVDVTVHGDTEDEDDETLTFRWTNWANVLLASYTATGTIEDDDDPAPYIGLSSPGVTEGDAGTTTMTFTAKLSDENGRPRTGTRTITATYKVSTEDGNTATAGTDYTATTGTLTFAPGETVKTFDVDVLGDTEEEDDETFTVRWTAWTDVMLVQYAVTGTIRDDDGAPAVTIADAEAQEGSAIAFTVTLDKAVSGGLTVTPTFTDGTATQGTDYSTNTGALDFAGTAGETVSFTVPTTDDVDIEEDETFTVGLSVSGTSHTVTATSTATGSILDDDGEVTGAATKRFTVSVQNGTVNEASSAQTIRVRVIDNQHFNRGWDLSGTLAVGKSGDGATEGTDYETVADVSFEIAQGSQEKWVEFTLTPKQDTNAEGNETITLTASASGYEDRSITMTLTDDEITLTSNVSSVTEGDVAQTVTVTATGASTSGSARTVSVQVGNSSDGATEGTDYATVANFNVTIAANASSGTGTFTLTPTDDTNQESAESISITGSISGGATVIASSITLNDNDIALSVNPSTVSEDAQATSVTVTATGGLNSTSRTVRVSVGSSSDSPTEGTDYLAVADFLITIPTGSASATGTFTLTPINDSQYEFNQYISITGIAPHLSVNGTRVLLDDNDADISITMNLDKTSVSESGGAQQVKVTLTDNRDNYNGDPEVTVKVGRTGDGATSGTDYAAVDDFTMKIYSASKFQLSAEHTFTLTPTNDADPEWSENITVYADDWYGATVGEGVISLTDDDGGSITLSTNTSSVSEGASATEVTVTATADKQQPAARTMTVYVGNTGSATYGEDYSPDNISFTLMIQKYQTSGTANFTLTPIQDKLVEGNETIGISASLAGFSTTGTSITLTDDDTAPAVNLSVSPSSMDEDASGTKVNVTAAFSNTSTYSSDKTVTVSVGGSGTATSGTDYSAVSDFDITINKGTTSGTGTFTLTPTDDTSPEDDETIGISGTSTGLTVNSTTLTLNDNDDDAVTLSANKSSVAESGSATTVTVTATANTSLGSARTVTVAVGSSTDGATEGTDYTTVDDFTITIAANDTTGTGTFTLTPTQDTSVEGDESIGISGSGTSMTVTGTSMKITDDDTRTIDLSVDKSTVGEGDGGTTVTVTATAKSAVTAATTVTVSVGATGDGATSGTDYTAVADFDITIAASATSNTGTFTLTPTDDSTYEGDESVSVTGSASPHTVNGTSLAIGNNDGISISLSASPDSVVEGAGATSVTVTATAPQERRWPRH